MVLPRMTRIVKIGIVGSRSNNSIYYYYKVYGELETLVSKLKLLDSKIEVHIISGGSRLGADSFAEKIVSNSEYHFTRFVPQYTKYGRSAPLVRNTLIAQESEYLIACVHFDRIGGTEDTIAKFCQFHKNENLKEKLIIVK